jgi:hypothetical protein
MISVALKMKFVQSARLGSGFAIHDDSMMAMGSGQSTAFIALNSLNIE